MEQFNHQDSDVIDLREIFAILRKRYMVIITLTLAALVTSGVLSFFVMTPVYETKAVLLVTQAAPDKPVSSGTKDEGLEGLVNSISRLPEMTINTYVGQLKSEAVLQKVLKKLSLDKNGYTLGSLSGAINVQAVKDTNLVEVKVSNTDPILAAKIGNTMTEEFLNFISETNNQQLTKSVEFLTKQAEANGQNLKQAIGKLNNLQAQPRSALMVEQLITAKTADLSKYQSQLLQANMEHQQILAGKQQAEAQLKSTAPTITVVKSTDSATAIGPTVQTEEVNPAYTELKTMVNTKTVAAVEKGAEVKSLQIMITLLTNELKNLQVELAQKKNALELAQKEVTRLEETNTLLRQKIDETKIGSSMKFGETSLVVVSPANIPSAPVKPNKMMNMAIALVLGLMVSVGLSFLLHYLDNTVKSPKEVEELLGLTVLGSIPHYKTDQLKATRR